jgi:rare lipoprotein A
MFELIALMLLSQQPMQPVAEGVASYYTVHSSGQRTASGETLRDGEFTCAMLDGHFGEYFLVVADNGRSVVCRLNDRGPFVKGRVIDLSKAAMKELDPKRGLLDVKVYRLGFHPPPSPISIH